MRKVQYKKYRQGPGAIRFQFRICDAWLIRTHTREVTGDDGKTWTWNRHVLRKIGKRGGPVGKEFEVQSIIELQEKE